MLVWVTIYWCCWCCWCWWKAMTTGWRYRLGNSLITTFHSLHFLINSKTNFFVVCLSNCFVKALKKGKQNELGRADLCKSFDWNILLENKSHLCPGFFTCFQLFCELWSKCSKGKKLLLSLHLVYEMHTYWKIGSLNINFSLKSEIKKSNIRFRSPPPLGPSTSPNWGYSRKEKFNQVSII